MKFSILPLASAFCLLLAASPHALAAGAPRDLEITSAPQKYVVDLLGDAAKDGMQPIRDFVARMGVTSPQMDATLDLIESQRVQGSNNIVRIIEETDSAGILRQVYAYTYFGSNMWFFWRFDFVLTKDGWAVSAFNFNSDYAQVKGQQFASTTVLKPITD